MKKLISLTFFAFLSCLLFVGVYSFNGNTCRVQANKLTPSLVYESGPVMLEGGSILPHEDGTCEYRISFHWKGSGYLYAHMTNVLLINGITPESEASYRGNLYTLPYKEDGNYEISLFFANRYFTSFETALYFGTFSQMNSFIATSIQCNYYVQGLCFAVTLFSVFLFYWKRSERYLIWLALLAFTVSSYHRMGNILSLFSWVPQLAFFNDTYFYRIFFDVVVSLIQCKVIHKLLPREINPGFAAGLILAASVPAFINYSSPLLCVLWDSVFFFILYIYYLVCFLRIPDSLHLERHIFLFGWFMTTTARLFEHLCETGLLLSGNINMRLRFRGIISVIYVLVFFLVACKRFAQKFQEADDLNASLEQQIIEKSRQQTSFIRSMLHNLKTPLFSLSGYSDMALKSVDANPAQARQYIQKTHEKAIYAGHMMDQIFLVTQMESGLVQMQTLPMNLADTLRSVIETSLPEAKSRSITLTLDIPAVMTASGDPLYLQQAFQNIIDNALIHTSIGGTITVSGQKEDSHWQLTFADNGCGISSEEQPKIFDAYYSNRPGQAKSSGLGLYITKEILIRHGGNITVDSTLGKGTTFTLRLPISESDPLGKI